MILAVVCCFQDEEAYLPTLLGSIEAQQRPPEHLLLVDDGSRDGSPAIADAFAATHPYAEVLHRPRRPPEADRLAQAAELLAFQAGVASLREPCDVIVKLDGDLELPPATFAAILDAFEVDPQLGVAGAYLSVRRSDGTLEREPHPPDHVRGPNKFYRWACYEAIAPLPTFLGWDGVDELRARLRGWTTRSVEVPGGDPVHLRPTGGHGGAMRAWRRWGECAWGAGVSPLEAPGHALVNAARRRDPRAAFAYLTGYCAAAVGRRPRAEKDVRALHRREAWARARRLLK